MNKLSVLLLATFISSAFAQDVRPNQTCVGVNDYNEEVETKLYVGNKIDKDFSHANLSITWGAEGKVVKGIITNKKDLMGTRMFKNTDDSLRYQTTGFLYDLDSYRLRLNMKCSKFQL